MSKSFHEDVLSSSIRLPRDKPHYGMCPTCLEVQADENYFICENGHSVCGVCKPRLFLCPVCRCEYRRKLTRNLALEQALRDDPNVAKGCKNKNLNCSYKGKKESHEEHEYACPYNHMAFCPQPGCTSNLPVEHLRNHLKDTHKNFYPVDVQSGFYDLELPLRKDRFLAAKLPAASTCQIKFDTRIFHLAVYPDVVDDTCSIVVLLHGLKHKAQRYNVSIAIFGQDTQDPLFCSLRNLRNSILYSNSSVFSVEQKITDVLKDEQCFTVPKTMLIKMMQESSSKCQVTCSVILSKKTDLQKRYSTRFDDLEMANVSP